MKKLEGYKDFEERKKMKSIVDTCSSIIFSGEKS